MIGPDRSLPLETGKTRELSLTILHATDALPGSDFGNEKPTYRYGPQTGSFARIVQMCRDSAVQLPAIAI
jgi:hypothetical protein